MLDRVAEAEAAEHEARRQVEAMRELQILIWRKTPAFVGAFAFTAA
jgi:hypothetical protein